MIIIDGSEGEGGGQIVRTALSLSMITGQPFRIEHIRAKRAKPGLMRQHLTCVTAARTISSAKVTGAELGSKAIAFVPGPIEGGNYTFAIGTAGATTLVFQTILPALLCADQPSHVSLQGGTHNPFAPTFDYLDRVFCPLLARMGAPVALTLRNPGFYPAGGGVWEAAITPAMLAPLQLEETGARRSQSLRADVANLPYLVAQREIATAAGLLDWAPDCGAARTIKAEGHGNVLMAEIVSENVTEIFSGFGERAKTAEAVAAGVVEEVKAYLAVGAPVGQHLADQLLVPMALAGAGSFVTGRPTLHTATNVAVIEKFLPVAFQTVALDGGRWRVCVRT